MNTKILKTTIVMSIVLLLVSACGMIPTIGSRNVISETRQVSGYDRVEVSGGGTLEIVQDGTESLTVETDDNMMPYVTSEVRGRDIARGVELNRPGPAPQPADPDPARQNLGGVSYVRLMGRALDPARYATIWTS